MDIAARYLAGWYHDNDLFLNVLKTKELFLCNLRDNPVHDNLIIDGNSVEQVDSFTYLGTVTWALLPGNCYPQETKISRAFHGGSKESPKKTLHDEEAACQAHFCTSESPMLHYFYRVHIFIPS